MFYANGATGTVSGNTIYDYQKNGVHVCGLNTSVKVLNNTITGRGPIDTIAQNGIVIHAGASAQIIGNTISGHSYTPTSDIACGLLLYRGWWRQAARRPGIVSIKKDNTITRQRDGRLQLRQGSARSPANRPARQLMHREARSGGPLLCESSTTTPGARIGHTSVMGTGLAVGGDVEQALESVGVPSYVLD